MRVTGLWELSDGAPRLRPGLERSDDAKLNGMLLGFLAGGDLVLRSPGLREDRLDPSHPPRVPVGYRSDGEWIWPLELAYYLQRHGLLPEEEFVAHIRNHGFEAPKPSPEKLAEAAELLSGG